MNTPLHISVIITTRNRAGYLPTTISSLRSQDYGADRYEIVVLDDGSTDDTRAVVETFQDGKPPTVRYVWQAPQGQNAARNHGWKQARAKLVAFVDDDVDVPPHWLSAFADALGRHPEVAIFGGPYHPRIEGQKPPPRICGSCGTLEDLERFYPGDREQEYDFISGGNMIIRPEAIERTGFFTEGIHTYLGNEAEWLVRARRAGLKVMYIPDAWFWHRRSTADVGYMLLKRKFMKNVGWVRFAMLTRADLPDPLQELRGMARWTSHYLRRRCFRGLVKAAAHAGLLLGWLRWALAKRALTGREEPSRPCQSQ